MAPLDRPIAFGSYLLLDRTRIGGSAELWRAVRARAPRELVALKRLLPTVAEDAELAARFRREARIALELAHPAIACAYERGRVGARPFLAMEYVPGVDLRDLLARYRENGTAVPIPLACHAVVALLRALDYLHGRGIVHGDVSPENLVVSFEGACKLIDFGLAQPSCEPAPSGAGVYRAPEASAGGAVDARADIWSAGLVLAELITSRRPESAEVSSGTPALDAIATRALSREPADRFATASEFADALEPFASGFTREGLAAALRARFPQAYAAEIALAARVRQRSGSSERP